MEHSGHSEKQKQMMARRDHERTRMEEARAAQSQTVKRAKEARATQGKRTRSEQVSEQRLLRTRK